MNDSTQLLSTIAIIGGTGKEGKGLAYRWAKSGYQILIGSRSKDKAEMAANEINQMALFARPVVGLENVDAAHKGEIIVLTVPYMAHVSTLDTIRSELSGKILIDVTVPLVPPKVTRVQMPAAGSAAQEAQVVVGADVQVVAAFQNISYEHLLHDEVVDCDVLVCGGNKAARSIVIRLVEEAGLTGWDAGPIENSVVVEGLTSVLIGLNRQFGVQSAGIRITGVPHAKRGLED